MLRVAAHCLDILRQQLMCTVDIGVLGQIWWNKESPTAYPDFNTRHERFLFFPFHGLSAKMGHLMLPCNVR